MWLYRVLILYPGEADEESGGIGEYFDATHSKFKAIKFAEDLAKRRSFRVLRVEREFWPNLNFVRYWLFRVCGLSYGFGTQFTDRWGYEIEETVVVHQIENSL